MNLTTLCSVKAYMGIPSSDTSRDGVINAMIPGTSKAATKFMGRRFGEYRYTEYYSGNGTAQLVLNHTPVSPTDLEVWVDPTGAWGQGPSPAFPDADKLDVGTYALELDTPEGLSGSGILVRIGNVWPFAATRYWLNQSPPLSADGTIRSGNIKVAYTAGEPVPDDVTVGEQASAQMRRSNVDLELCSGAALVLVIVANIDVLRFSLVTDPYESSAQLIANKTKLKTLMTATPAQIYQNRLRTSTNRCMRRYRQTGWQRFWKVMDRLFLINRNVHVSCSQ